MDGRKEGRMHEQMDGLTDAKMVEYPTQVLLLPNKCGQITFSKKRLPKLNPSH